MKKNLLLILLVSTYASIIHTDQASEPFKETNAFQEQSKSLTRTTLLTAVNSLDLIIAGALLAEATRNQSSLSDKALVGLNMLRAIVGTALLAYRHVNVPVNEAPSLKEKIDDILRIKNERSLNVALDFLAIINAMSLFSSPYNKTFIGANFVRALAFLIYDAKEHYTDVFSIISDHFDKCFSQQELVNKFWKKLTGAR
jgi:hypothetical protein